MTGPHRIPHPLMSAQASDLTKHQKEYLMVAYTLSAATFSFIV